uniref:hypothetical protein n=1 Tax=Cutaneotrichosporon mucoides TaxID=82522 RepID=UPI00226D1C4D|nr:hypothetical protein OYW89_mgp15 [Cutaneotrichosporon mucoides]UZC57681.1 hypothetical protein [Cutaneotrichosporon mucoides]
MMMMMMMMKLTKNYNFYIKTFLYFICALVMLTFYIYVMMKYYPVLCAEGMIIDSNFRNLVCKYSTKGIPTYQTTLEGMRQDIDVWNHFIKNIEKEIDRINTLQSNNVPYINTETSIVADNYREHIRRLTHYSETAQESKREILEKLNSLY